MDGGRVLDAAFWMIVAGLVGSRIVYGSSTPASSRASASTAAARRARPAPCCPTARASSRSGRAAWCSTAASRARRWSATASRGARAGRSRAFGDLVRARARARPRVRAAGLLRRRLLLRQGGRRRLGDRLPARLGRVRRAGRDGRDPRRLATSRPACTRPSSTRRSASSLIFAAPARCCARASAGSPGTLLVTYLGALRPAALRRRDVPRRRRPRPGRRARDAAPRRLAAPAARTSRCSSRSASSAASLCSLCAVVWTRLRHAPLTASLPALGPPTTAECHPFAVTRQRTRPERALLIQPVRIQFCAEHRSLCGHPAVDPRRGAGDATYAPSARWRSRPAHGRGMNGVDVPDAVARRETRVPLRRAGRPRQASDPDRHHSAPLGLDRQLRGARGRGQTELRRTTVRPVRRGSDHAQDHQQHQRADEGDQDRAGDAAPRDVDVQAAEDEAADESADDADDDVTDHAVAAARHRGREPARRSGRSTSQMRMSRASCLTSLTAQASHASGERKGPSYATLSRATPHSAANARALTSVSASSPSGVESATTPPPTDSDSRPPRTTAVRIAIARSRSPAAPSHPVAPV